MTLVGVCDDCGYADGGHAPSCPRWQTMTGYEFLKGQKDAILEKEKMRGDARATQLEETQAGIIERERTAMAKLADMYAELKAERDALKLALEREAKTAIYLQGLSDRRAAALEKALMWGEFTDEQMDELRSTLRPPVTP